MRIGFQEIVVLALIAGALWYMSRRASAKKKKCAGGCDCGTEAVKKREE